MSKEHEAIIDDILDKEKGYQNSRNDKANLIDGVWVGTNRGITPATYKAALGKTPTAADMKALTTKQAREIYQTEFIDPVVRNIKPTGDLLKQIVDIHVHSGWGNMVSILQRASGAKVDGRSGPGLKAAMTKNAAGLENRLVNTRLEDFERQVREKPEKQEFLQGWRNRAESFRTAPIAAPTPPPQVLVNGQ